MKSMRIGGGRMIIGLTGKAGSGKNFVASRLCELFGYEIRAFADPLKAAVQAMFGVPDDKSLRVNWATTDIGLPDREEGLTVRELYQWFGTDLVRKHVGQEFWVTRAEIDLSKSPMSNVVFTDVRFNNEAEMIHRHGGQIWLVTGRYSPDCPAHSSEQGISLHMVDYTINNSLNGSAIVDRQISHTVLWADSNG